MSQGAPEYHDVIVVGGGVAGLGVATLLGGWRPRLQGPVPKPLDHPSLKSIIEDARDDLLSMDMRALAEVPVSPFDVFRLLHHPQQEYRGLEAYPLRFEEGAPFDWLMLTDEPVGGLWNNVPRNQLTLSPAHWMELSAYPVARYFEEQGIAHDPNELIRKDLLVSYYHYVPSRLGIEDNIEVGWIVENVAPGGEGEGRFRLSARRRDTGEKADFTCEYLVYAAGPRVKMRRLGVPGEYTQHYVSHHYDHFDDYPGDRVMVVGGGRSADWAATELHDAGRDVTYVMRP
ncbi:MAG: NAD(P)-binding domain-containing protein, partial [Chloroflexota bacterium]